MNIKVLSHNYTGKSLVVVSANGKGVKTQIVEQSHPNWSLLFALYAEKKWDELVPAMSIEGAINTLFKGRFTVANGKVFYEGKETGGYLMDRILFFMREIPKQAERLVRFAENLYQNPNPAVIAELYKFLEHKNNPITDDGCFLAYKGVGVDYYSHTAGNIKILKGKVKDGRVYNGVGEEIIAERKDVCDNADIGCAPGLHIGSWEYANGFKGDGHLMVVKTNPRDAVMVPHDCSYQKLRSCRYEVIAEEGRKLNEVKDSNFDKVAKVRFNRDSLGRFSSFCRDANGRFAPKQ